MHISRILCFAGSNRSGSLNQALAGAMAKQLGLLELDVTFLSLRDYPLPLYDADDEASKGLPEEAVRLAAQMASHDGIFIASPEYNASIPPLLKNALDWVSRVPAKKGHPFRTPVYAIGSASPGKFGGARGLMHLRQILVAMGAVVLPDQISITQATDAFDVKGDLARDGDNSHLMRVASQLKMISQQMKPFA